MIRSEIIFLLKTSLAYGCLSLGFSFVGLLLPGKNFLPNPLTNGSFSFYEILGHILFGLIAGTITLSLRYTLLTGAFAVLIDMDHVVNLLHIEAISRMSHSISFGIMALVGMMILFGKKDYRLGSVAFGGMLSHVAYDVYFPGDPGPPFFAPFTTTHIPLPGLDWLILEVMAIVIIGFCTIVWKKTDKQLVER